jgi:hypothetical protein
MQEAARLGFDRTGVLPSLWFQPRAYRKALPNDSSKLQAGRGCSLFIVRDVGPFELVRVHGGGSDGQ